MFNYIGTGKSHMLVDGQRVSVNKKPNLDFKMQNVFKQIRNKAKLS